MKEKGYSEVSYVQRDHLVDHLLTHSGLHGVIAFLGAGNIGATANEFTDRYQHLTTT